MVKRSTSVRFDELDTQAIRAIREQWGAPSLNAAVSYAVRVVARAREVAVASDLRVGERRITLIRLDEADDEAIRVIRKRWSLSSDGTAVRFALRVLAGADRLDVVPARLKPE